jgi:hypothetical protein|tara:strand:- start:66 stop:332 length:267 start_codon:yes stop_codon:yes gene_type:complete
MIYIRYEFNDKEQAESKILSQEGVNATFIKLNKFILTEGVYDNEGVELTAPILSEGYALDVLWRDLDASPYGWKSYEVEPSNPKHKLL